MTSESVLVCTRYKALLILSGNLPAGADVAVVLKYFTKVDLLYALTHLMKLSTQGSSMKFSLPIASTRIARDAQGIPNVANMCSDGIGVYSSAQLSNKKIKSGL